MNATDVLVWTIFGLAALPALMTAWNLCLLLPLRGKPDRPFSVSVLIPARNEESSIAAAVESALASVGVEVEVVVLDDQSDDATSSVVQAIASRDRRVRLLHGQPLPIDEGWCGKQWACWQLSRAARHDVLAWMDADVRLQPDGLARLARQLQRSRAGLLSAFPHQATASWMEQLVVPQIMLVLVGYLPIALMRRFDWPGLGAGCGQLMLARRADYEAIGGHAAPGVRGSMHDGVTLPRAFRRAGVATDLVDGADLATCRMYRDARGVWQGFAKNATEGMATPIGLPVWTGLLLGGHVLPWVMIVVWAAGGFDAATWHRVVLWGAWCMSAATSLAVTYRFGQTWRSALLRPIGVVVLVAIQWYAALRKAVGRPAGWRGRAYAAP